MMMMLVYVVCHDNGNYHSTRVAVVYPVYHMKTTATE